MAGKSGAHWIVRAPPDKSTWGPCSLSGSCYRGKKYGDQSERDKMVKPSNNWGAQGH